MRMLLVYDVIKIKKGGKRDLPSSNSLTLSLGDDKLDQNLVTYIYKRGSQ